MRLLGNYNSLLDDNLAEYFSNPRIRRHLIRAGLIRQNGELVSPQDYKSRVLEEQRWLASQAFLARAIVQRALDLEFSRRAHLQTKLEEIIRLELVERVRSARQKSQPSAGNDIAGTHHCDSRRENFARKKTRSVPDETTEKFSERDSTTFDIVQYLIFLLQELKILDQKMLNILIARFHCAVFSFVSKRYVDFPFSVTIYVDNILALKLSACCEYKYTVGYRLGGPQGYFMLLGVHGSKPCPKCNPRKKNKNSGLPPVKKRMSPNGNDFKSLTKNSLVKSTWSKRPYSAKKVALISPSGKPNDKIIKSKDNGNSSWILNVGISPWVETNVDNLKCEDFTIKEPSLTKTSKEMENVSEEEVDEEIPLEMSLLKEEDTAVIAEVEEELDGEKKENEETGSSDSDSDSTVGSNSGSSYTGSSTSRGTAVGGPKIRVINADGTKRNSSSSSGSSSSGSSSSGTEEETDDDDNDDNDITFLKPKDAQVINQKTMKQANEKVNDDRIKLKTIEEVAESNKNNEKRQVSLQKMVAIDSSDDEDAALEIQQTIVHADVHTTNDDITDNKLDRRKSTGRRNSICQIVRNLSTASEDGEKDFPDMESQSSSVQDNGNDIEVIGQDISGQINELCEELQYRPDLITLTISKGGIDDLNIVPVIDALINSNCPLKSLNLNFNRLGPQSGQQIARLIREKPTLNHLFLRANPLHDSGLCPIVNALLAHNSSNLQINDTSFGLHTLDVGNCNFRNEGATNLASLIEQSRNLNTLVLTGNNQLNDDDWSSIFWAVGQNSQVSTLFVDYCYIGDDGIDCLTGTVAQHPSLQALDLEWNQIGDEGAKLLLNWIKQNPKLTQVRFEC
uniref:DUF4590 domain-containing protein n=1 Tax=Strigamia maritima TaxID=126957 RepID=T1IPG0_STRMM